MKVYVCHVPDNLPEMKIGVYLTHALPLLPYNVVRDALNKKDVKANGVRLSKEDNAPRGSEIRLYTTYEAALETVYEDDRVLIINKPAGLSADEDDYGGQTLQSILADCFSGGESFMPVHRLDNKTSGLLMVAKDAETAGLLTDAIKDRAGICKQYECVVKGTVRPPQGTGEAWLVKDPARASVRVITHNTPGSKYIKTGWETLASDGRTTRLLVTLYTGRTHQIRAHMAFLGHPLAGDDLYGDRTFNRPWQGRLLLCATRLSFDGDFPLESLKNREFCVKAPF